MATTQSLRMLTNYLVTNNGKVPDYGNQFLYQSPLERFGIAMRYATNLVQYYKEGYEYSKDSVMENEQKNKNFFED